MSRTPRVCMCLLVGTALAAIPGCQSSRTADGRALDAPTVRPAGMRMMASDYVGGMVFSQPERKQGDTSFATVPTE